MPGLQEMETRANKVRECYYQGTSLDQQKLFSIIPYIY